MVNLKDKLIQSFKHQHSELSFIEQRKEHMHRLEEMGFPTIKNEEWKYTNLLPILKNDYQLSVKQSTVTKPQLDEYILTDTDTYLMVFVNGQYSDSLSRINTKNIIICTLDQAEKQHPELLKNYWGKCLPKEPDSLASLNTALSQDGTFIFIPKNTLVEKPIQIVYLTNEVSQDLFLQTRNLIVAQDNTQVQITERHQNIDQKEVFTNSLTEIYAQDNVVIDFYKIQNDKQSCSLIDNTWVKQGKNTYCTVDTFSFGGKFIRNNLNFLLEGQHSESNMRGITLIGKEQLVDHHTLVDHAVPHCQSNELYKGIFDEKAKAFLMGK